MIRLHLAALVLGSILDLIIGDPHSIPHPVQLIGKLISALDRTLQARAERQGSREANRATAGGDSSRRNSAARQTDSDAGPLDGRNDGSSAAKAAGSKTSARKRRYGCLMAAVVVLCTAAVSAAILALCYHIHPYLGCIIEAVMTCQILAGRSLEKESMKVYRALEHGTLQEARKAVSMIVGRDTQNLSVEGVTKAAVETVAENASDGVIAPMLYTALGGPVLGWIYKAINTMDSMVGYRNDRYLDFGRGPAHLDDVANYLPSRISAVLMIAAAWLLENVDRKHFRYDAANAARIWRRDRRKHASPNSAQTESVMAGALQVQLAGDAFYFGRLVKKPYIGDPIRSIVPEDIRRANCLMLCTAALMEVICVILLALAG